MRRMSKAAVGSLREAGDYRALYNALLDALPRCTACGRCARFMTTATSEFSCGCDAPLDDQWEPVPWKAHVDVALALTSTGKRNRRDGARALEVTANDRTMAAGHNLQFKHEDEVRGVAVGPVSWVTKGSTPRRAGCVRERDGSPQWFSIIEVRAFATVLGIDVVEV